MPVHGLPEPTPVQPAQELIAALLARCPDLTLGRAVTCGVSGGPDSMALLALACAAGCVVTAVHVDHGLRPGGAAEAALVAGTATRFGARFRAVTVDVGAGPNQEARARAARHAALGPDALTGHTADDQAETMLINLLRGGALNGLAGMRRERHPLLALRRAETHALCAVLGLNVVTDPTNASAVHLRNRVRGELLPALNELAGRDLVPVLTRQATLWRDDVDLLDELAAGIDVTKATALAAAPIALARRAVRAWLTGEHPPDLAAVERVLSVAGGEIEACEVDGGRRVVRHRQRLSLEARPLR